MLAVKIEPSVGHILPIPCAAETWANVLPAFAQAPEDVSLSQIAQNFRLNLFLLKPLGPSLDLILLDVIHECDADPSVEDWAESGEPESPDSRDPHGLTPKIYAGHGFNP